MAISHVSNPSSSMSPRPDYQVFLSFRGPDTRRNFADFLYTSLTDVGIRVFRDEEEQEKGKEMNPQLIQAIEQSKISIPIISEKYASSYSCLMELKKMVDCKDIGSHSIIPIFYYVNPSDVRNCTGPFERALNKKKKRGMAWIKKKKRGSILNPWKPALERIGDLVGYHLHENQEKTHGDFIKPIVREVEQMLRTRDLMLPKQLVGVDPHVQEIMAKLKVEYRNGEAVKIGDTCRKVLIHGIPGVGKTVLAKCVYNQLNHLFDACSFLEKIQEEINSHKTRSVVSVQNRLISHLHKGNAQQFDNYDPALKQIEARFWTMKVLLLLDDVKDHEQLSKLFGELDWFGPGSTVIVTSPRDDVLKKHKGAVKFGLRTMQPDRALQLFSRHAFEKDSPPEKFKVLAPNIAAAIDGLPLALENVGQSLFQVEEKKVWMETLTALTEAPDRIVQAALSKSYNTLEENEQDIFLDIACFFDGKDKRIPYYMWHDCNFYPSRSILSLCAMSLVEIGEDKELCMRGILKTFGREIVKNENKKEPCQRSRLWNHNEALDVLEGKGTEKVEGLRLKFADRIEGNTGFKCDHFDGLRNLRFLKLDQADIQGNFQNHFLRLRWLDWQGSPRISDIQSDLNLNLQNLVILDLSGSQVDTDWRGWELLKQARKLKVLKLTGCVQLTATPNFPGSMELKRLILEGCSNLEVINPSDLEKLVSLNVKGCSLLRGSLDLGSLIHLKELQIDGTSISQINFYKTMLKTLTARNCKELTDLSDVALLSLDLKHLALDNSGIVTLGESIKLLENLETLSLKNCKGLSNLPDEIGKLSSLQFLDLSGTEICTLPESIRLLENLETLSLKNCKGLSNLPDEIGKLSSLQFLDLSGTEICTLPESIRRLEKLNALSLNNCQRLFNLSDGIGNLRSLQLLDLSNTLIQELPPSLENLKAMKVLRMRGTSIQNFPQAILHLQKLEEVDFSSCQSLEGIIPSNICKLSSLVILKLSDSRISGLPQSISCLSRLRELHIPRRDNLQGVPELPPSVDVFYDMGN